MKSPYGFTKPYNVARALPFLTAIVLLLLIIATTGVLAFLGDLSWDTYRSAYFLYLGALAFVGAALSYAPQFAWLLIALCFIEYSLGGASALGNKVKWTQSVLPLNIKLNSLPQFQYHPLLQGTPTPNLVQLTPYRIQHDSYGLRGTERQPIRLKEQIVIATVGGSTTYGVGVPNGQTWSDALEHKLGHEYAALNHGVPGYSTAEHVIQTAFYLKSYGISPQCAVYYVGLNDIRSAHLPNLDPAYADHLLSQVDNLRVRRMPLLAKVSPLVRTLMLLFEPFVDSVPLPERLDHVAPQQGSDIRLERIFRANLETIAAINKERGITSLFVAQVLNRAELEKNPESIDSWIPLVREIDTWPLQAHFNAILKDTADAVGSPEFVPPIDEFQNGDFVDESHFSPQGAEKFAGMLAPLMRANCKK